MPALGTSAHAVLKRTEYELETGLFWYFSKSMRDEALGKIEGLTKDKMYPMTVARAAAVVDAIHAHELSASMLAPGDQVIFVFMTMDKKAKRGDTAVVIRAQEGSDTVDVVLDADPSMEFAVPRLLLRVSING